VARLRCPFHKLPHHPIPPSTCVVTVIKHLGNRRVDASPGGGMQWSIVRAIVAHLAGPGSAACSGATGLSRPLYHKLSSLSSFHLTLHLLPLFPIMRPRSRSTGSSSQTSCRVRSGVPRYAHEGRAYLPRTTYAEGAHILCGLGVRTSTPTTGAPLDPFSRLPVASALGTIGGGPCGFEARTSK